MVRLFLVAYQSKDKKMSKSGDIVIDCEKLILLKYVFYSCHFDMAKKKEKKTLSKMNHAPMLQTQNLRNSVSKMTHPKWTKP